jgi:ATP-dependent Lon protease
MKNNLPVMLLKRIVLLPLQDVRLDLTNDISSTVIDLAISKYKGEILIVCPTDPYEEAPDVSDLPPVGVVGKIKSKMELPNGNLRIVVSGQKRVKILEYINEAADGDILKARTMEIVLPMFDEVEETTLRRKLLSLLNDYIECSSTISNSILSSVKDLNDIAQITDMIVSFMPFSIEKKLLYMQEMNALHRANALVYDLSIELQVAQLDVKLDEVLRNEFEENQREYVLREKLEVIRKELGEDDLKDEIIGDYLERINELKAPGKLKNKLTSEVKKLDYTSESNPEVSSIRNYLDLVLDLPFGIYSADEKNLEKIREVLDSSHFGLDKAKNRIVEYIAVKIRNKNLKSPILCFVGPPGVGKTSLAIAIAKSLKKEFYKISVGGLNDGAELNGHRRTYIGASPGKIIQALKKCGTANPLMLIDEIDKMVKDYKGDPASVLLDILDPEQNDKFVDNYVEEEFDLSEVMFILTANNEEDIPDALYDRLEIVELTSYTEFEKLDIAKDYLIPNIFKEHLVCSKEIKFSNDIIMEIINRYTKEAGVRDLQRNLSTIVRKIVTKSVRELNSPIKVNVKKSDLHDYLGPYKYDVKNEAIREHIGLVNALAYTPMGGLVLPVETTIYDGKGEFKFTGMIGKTMEESVNVALSYVKANKDEFKVNDYYFDNRDMHIHFLEGAVKKDGPSAGVSIVTSILSLLLNKEIPRSIAMTGEVSLLGDVLKVGGIKEKIIGAYNDGVKKIFIPYTNNCDLEEVPKEIRDEVKIILVKTYKEIFDALFK